MVDRFLADNKLALRDRPIEIATSQVAAPVSLGESGRAAFKNYLQSGPNKAFAVSGAHYGWVSGRRSADAAHQGCARRLSETRAGQMQPRQCQRQATRVVTPCRTPTARHRWVTPFGLTHPAITMFTANSR